MRIFITGGTGLIGSVLVPKLLEENHEITVLTRNPSRIKFPLENVTYIEGDPQIIGEWRNSLHNQEVIINLVGENIIGRRWTKKQKTRLYNSRIKSKNNLIEVISGLDSKPQVFISPSGVDYYPVSDEMVFTEDDPPATNFVASLCNDWEPDPVIFKTMGIRLVVFRFGLAFTPTGRGGERMFLANKLFIGGWMGSGKQPFAWIHIEDMVGLILWAINNSHVDGTYNAVAEEKLTMKQISKLGARIMKRPSWTRIPAFVIKILLGERSRLLLQGRYVSCEKVKEAGYKFHYPDATSALIDILKKPK